MIDRQELDPARILDERELAAITQAQEVTAASAKLAAAEVGMVIDLEEEAIQGYVGKLGLRLAELTYKERDAIARHYARIASILGRTGTSNGVVTMPEAVVLEISPHTNEPVAVAPAVVTWPTETDSGAAAANEEGDWAGTDQEDDADAEPDATGQEKNDGSKNTEAIQYKALTKARLNWFGQIYDEPTVDVVHEMSLEKLGGLVNKIVDLYMDLDIPWSETNKPKRTKQFKEFISGEKTIKQIAQEDGVSYVTMWANLRKFATMIRDKIPQADLKNAIRLSLTEADVAQDGQADASGYEDEEPKGLEELVLEQGPVALSTDQLRWLEMLLQDRTAIGLIQEMQPVQRAQLGESLAGELYPLILKKRGEDVSRRWQQTLRNFINGIALSEMAQERGVSVDAVWEDLLQSRTRLKDGLPKEKLLHYVLEAKDFTLSK